MNERTVPRNLIQGPQKPGQLGHHHAIDADGEVALVKMLLEAFYARQVKTKNSYCKLYEKGIIQSEPKDGSMLSLAGTLMLRKLIALCIRKKRASLCHGHSMTNIFIHCECI
jgi:hypothetical protein